MSERATLITRVYTDEGAVGECYNGDEPDTHHEIARIITDELQPLIMGEDPLLVERCWEAMLPPTFDILRNRKLVVMAMAAVDSALWDLAGKVANLPVYKLWGGYRTSLPIVAIGGYYGKTDAQLAAEMEDYLEMGLGGCKLKIGGLSPAEDAHRFKVAQAAAGDGSCSPWTPTRDTPWLRPLSSSASSAPRTSAGSKSRCAGTTTFGECETCGSWPECRWLPGKVNSIARTWAS